MADDDTNSMLLVGVLLCSIGARCIVLRPVTKFERDSEKVQKTSTSMGNDKA